MIFNTEYRLFIWFSHHRHRHRHRCSCCYGRMQKLCGKAAEYFDSIMKFASTMPCISAPENLLFKPRARNLIE